MKRFILIFLSLSIIWHTSAFAGDCQKIGSVCSDAAPCKTVSGMTICLAGATPPAGGVNTTESCWQYTDSYTCANVTQTSSDCAPLLSNSSCTQQSSSCVDTTTSGQCDLTEHKFQCMTSPGSSQQQVTCGNGVCVNNVCSAPNTPPDTDFATVISGMEAGREAGVYLDPNTMTLFNGTSASCTDKLGGISNCCNAKGGGANSSNSILMSGVKQFGIGLGKEAIRFLGSSYMYDALYSSDLVPDAVLNAIYGTTMSGVESGAEASFTFGGAAGEAHNFSFYGITYMPGMSPPIGFDPTSFAIAIAIQIVMQYLQCGQSDQLLALRKGQDLCTFIGSYCSTKVLGACVEQKESYCCYNSKLARIINEQGRAQIGKGYGNDIQNPDCSGFTVDQLNQLDFSKMDLSEFTQDIQANSLDTTKMLDRAQQTIQTQNSNYFSQP